MAGFLLYGRYKKLGQWVENIFTSVWIEARPMAVAYHNAQIAKEAAQDQEWVDTNIKTFIEALYFWYTMQVIMYTLHETAEEVDRRMEIILKASATIESSGKMLRNDIIRMLIKQRQGAMVGFSVEYILATVLTEQMDFSVTTGRDYNAFRDANLKYFKSCTKNHIEPFLYQVFANDTDTVDHLLSGLAREYSGE